MSLTSCTEGALASSMLTEKEVANEASMITEVKIHYLFRDVKGSYRT